MIWISSLLLFEAIFSFASCDNDEKNGPEPNRMNVPRIAGESLTVNLSGSIPVIEGGSSSATVVLANVQGVNGVVHVIDTVLLP